MKDIVDRQLDHDQNMNPLSVEIGLHVTPVVTITLKAVTMVTAK